MDSVTQSSGIARAGGSRAPPLIPPCSKLPLPGHEKTTKISSQSIQERFRAKNPKLGSDEMNFSEKKMLTVSFPSLKSAVSFGMSSSETRDFHVPNIDLKLKQLDRTRRAWVAPARDGRYVLGQLRSRTAGVPVLRRVKHSKGKHPNNRWRITENESRNTVKQTVDLK